MSKNLATCGEGGLVTTDDSAAYQRAVMLRQFGELIPRRGHRSYVSHLPGWNFKPSALNCAFTRGQLARFADDDRARNANVTRLLDRLRVLPGLRVPSVPADRTHAWHILRFALDADAFDVASVGRLREVVMSALQAEGVPVSHYQLLPLPAQPSLNGTASVVIDTARTPSAYQVIDASFTIQKAHLRADAGPLLDAYATAFEKVWAAADVIGRRARDCSGYVPPWQQAAALAERERPPT